MSETSYKDRTDSVEKKLRLLQDAYSQGNHDLTMSLVESIKDTVVFERQRKKIGADSVSGAETFAAVTELPAAWAQWARGWQFCKVLELSETAGIERRQEPVDICVGFLAEHTADLQREVRVARIDAATGTLCEVISQVYGEVFEEGERCCRVVFFADVPARGQVCYLVFYGNPFAELPRYATDLQVRGEGYGLDIENSYYAARLSRQMGQLERMRYKRTHGLELFIEGDGHGEPPHIDWAHDYLASNQFQKFRVTNWASCPNFEVVRGPLCTQVRRWGFPHAPAHPLFTPCRMHIDVKYTFYAGLPYFVKEGRMEMIQDFELNYLRDDEWLFAGHPFTQTVWMDREGILHEGEVSAGQGDDLWGVGFFNERNRECFIALFLDHSAENFDGLYHAGAPTLDYGGHGQLWSRWAARDNPNFKAGAVLKQHNAYIVEPYEGPEQVQQTRQGLLAPLRVGAAPVPSGARSAVGQLARRGETEDTAPLKKAIWQALREVPDDMYYRADANLVDMGYIYDLRVEDDLVRIEITMPHRGRPKFGYIANPLRRRLLELDGVREVIVDYTWEPAWNVARVTAAGREALGLEV